MNETVLAKMTEAMRLMQEDRMNFPILTLDDDNKAVLMDDVKATIRRHADGPMAETPTSPLPWRTPLPFSSYPQIFPDEPGFVTHDQATARLDGESPPSRGDDTRDTEGMPVRIKPPTGLLNDWDFRVEVSDAPAVVDFAELLPAGTVIKADAEGMFYDVTPGDALLVGPIDRGSQTILTGPFAPPALQLYAENLTTLLFEARFPDGYDKPAVEFRVAPMADPIIHFEHGVWYRIEVVAGVPTIRPLPPEE